MIRVKIQFCYSAVRFCNETALLSYYAICSSCYDSQVRYYEVEISHFIITNCNTDQYSILIQFAIITFCLPVTMVELRIANSSLAFKVSFTSSVRLSQLLPVFRYAVQLFCYAVQLCCYAVQLCCYVVQLCCYANPARSELDVRGLRTKAHSNSRWRRLCYCCRSLLSMEPVETIPSICF